MKDYTQVERDNAALTIREYAFGQMNMLRMLGDEDAANNLQEAINMAIAALRGPQPDPKTGLVPCGCGGKAEIGEYCAVTCDKCGASVPANYTEADAKAAWNTAMGHKGGAERHLTR